MKFSFNTTRAQLRVFSGIFTNLVVVWLIALFATKDLVVLTRDILLVILFLYLAVKTDEMTENYEQS